MDAAVLESVINSFSVSQTVLKSQIMQNVCQLTSCETFTVISTFSVANGASFLKLATQPTEIRKPGLFRLSIGLFAVFFGVEAVLVDILQTHVPHRMPESIVELQSEI